MTVIDMPTIGNTVPIKYELVRQHRASGVKGGVMQVVDDGPAFWRVDYQVHGALNDQDYHAYVSWIESLKGGINQFNAWVRKYPIAYPNDSYPNGFNGVAAVKHINGSAITVKNLPNGFTLLPGDLMTIEGNVDRLHRIQDGGTAVGSEISVTVDPAPHVSVSEDDLVHFSSPYFTAQIQPGYDLGSPVLGQRQITFSAIQRLKP